MRPIRLVIRTPVTVPTNAGSFHATRTDLRQIGSIGFNDSYQLFKCLNSNAPMTVDSQFAYWLYKTFGQGRYIINAWQKGYKGVWTFMNVVCSPDGFTRVPKYMTKEQQEKQKNVLEYKRLAKVAKSSPDADERKKAQEEVDSLKEDVELNKMIIEIDKEGKRHGCYPFLKTTIPIYRFHSYEEYENLSSEQTAKDTIDGGQSLW
jgi:hypothetical protein